MMYVAHQPASAARSSWSASALVYALVGTLNMADLAERTAALGGHARRAC